MPPQIIQALLNAEEAVSQGCIMMGLREAGRIESPTIVFDGYFDGVALSFDANGHLGGAGVFNDINEEFTNRSIQKRLMIFR